MSERDEIDEIIARAMRLQAVEANKILTNPAHVQNYVDTSWQQDLPAAQAAHAALEAAGFEIAPSVGKAANAEDTTGTPVDQPAEGEAGVIETNEM
jgi:hypothetical protein